MFVATLALSISLATMFLLAAYTKVTKNTRSIRIRDQLSVEPQLWTYTGLLEAAGAAGLLAGLAFPPIGVAAGIGLAVLMALAVVAHLGANDGRHTGPALALGLASILATIARVAST